MTTRHRECSSAPHSPQRRTLALKRIILVVTLLLCVSAVLLPRHAAAQTPPRADAFVYALTSHDGRVYVSTYAPPSADTIFMLANTDNVISPRETLIYFWNLTNRYEADWRVKNEIVEGTLELYQGDRLISATSALPYVMQIDENVADEAGRLYTGEQAQGAYDTYVQRQAAYRAALFTYARDYQSYREQVDELVANRGSTVLSDDDFPSPPARVPPFELFSTEMAYGHVVNLPAGNYRMQLRLADGTLLPDSVKTLEVFDALQEGVAYTVLPGARWTAPALSRTRDTAIYAPSDEMLYLQPFRQILYNEYQYAHLIDPQDERARRDRLEWVSFQPLDTYALEIEQNGSNVTQTASAFKVVQLAGSGLGYEVRQMEPDTSEAPSFVGYVLTSTVMANDAHIRLVDDNGVMVAGSARQARTIRLGREWLLYVLSMAPLVIGIALAWMRKMGTHRRPVGDPITEF